MNDNERDSVDDGHEAADSAEDVHESGHCAFGHSNCVVELKLNRNERVPTSLLFTTIKLRRCLVVDFGLEVEVLNLSSKELAVPQEHLILTHQEIVGYTLIELARDEVWFIVALKRVRVKVAILKLHVLDQEV
jgi:hypothetical protein